MADEDADSPEELTSRAPSDDDLRELCRELNRLEAQYIVVGGFAIRAAGYLRGTMDIDLLIETSLENEAKVYAALETLPDQCVRELLPGEVQQYGVVRVADEVLVDLMAAACGIRYEEARSEIVWHEADGVRIAFASPALLWKTKAPLNRPKDFGDLAFLREHFAAAGVRPPAV